jgi:pimeloyl-ACP methyl ester carboxylesterase
MAIETKTWTEKYLDMTHGKTRYWEAGTGYPTILIHGAGWTSGCETWAMNMGPLSEELRVLAIDCPYLVDHIREFMDVLGIEKANFIGHSMGGWLVTLMAYESPDRVNKLINVAGGGTATRPLQNMVEFKVPTPDQIRDQLAHRFPAGTDTTALAESLIKKQDLPGHAEAFAGVMRHMTNPTTRQRYNTLRRLPKIKAPTLVIWGRDDETNALEMGEATASGIPGAKLVVFDNVGHMLPQQRPDEFNKLALDFLTK